MTEVRLSGSRDDIDSLLAELICEFGNDKFVIADLSPPGKALLISRPKREQTPLVDIAIQVAEGLLVSAVVEWIKAHLRSRAVSVEVLPNQNSVKSNESEQGPSDTTNP